MKEWKYQDLHFINWEGNVYILVDDITGELDRIQDITKDLKKDMKEEAK